ncbi:unnamed protein product [Ectocarpus sp. 13 AM-2016]
MLVLRGVPSRCFWLWPAGFGAAPHNEQSASSRHVNIISSRSCSSGDPPGKGSAAAAGRRPHGSVFQCVASEWQRWLVDVQELPAPCSRGAQGVAFPEGAHAGVPPEQGCRHRVRSGSIGRDLRYRFRLHERRRLRPRAAHQVSLSFRHVLQDVAAGASVREAQGQGARHRPPHPTSGHERAVVASHTLAIATSTSWHRGARTIRRRRLREISRRRTPAHGGRRNIRDNAPRGGRGQQRESWGRGRSFEQ